MWLFSTYGFFSAVADLDNPGKVLVRARAKAHLVTLKRRFRILGPIPVRTTTGHDYLYRMTVCRAVWADVVNAIALETTYPNFKNAAKRARPGDRGYDGALHEVWGVMRRLQQQRGRRRRFYSDDGGERP